MPSLFSKPKSPPMPKVPDPAPLPVVGGESEEFAIDEQRQKSGIKKTFLTGNLSPKSTGKKTTLG